MSKKHHSSPSAPLGYTKKRMQITQEHYFTAVALLRYDREISIARLSETLKLSAASVKRMLRYLRQAGIIEGRLGHVRIVFSQLVKPPVSCSTANVIAALDVHAIRIPDARGLAKDEDVEYGLLRWICHTLPKVEKYQGRIIVERGQIQMGDPQSAMLISAHGASHDILFDFVRLGIEKTDGIVHTRTLSVARTVE